MKQCPKCNRTYTDELVAYCLYDGEPLVATPQPGAPQPDGPTLSPPGPAVSPNASWQPGVPAPPAKSQPNPWGIGIVVLLALFLGTRLFQAGGAKPGIPNAPAAPAQPDQPAGQPVQPVGQPPGITGEPTGGTPVTPGNPDPPQEDQAMLKEVETTIAEADQAEVEALKTGNYTLLQNFYSGEAYAREINTLSRLQPSGVQIMANLLSLNFDSQTFQTGGNPLKAKIHAQEQWNLQAKNLRTGQIRSLPGNFAATVYLEHNTDHWRIFRIQNDSGP